jgi:hypothetical protein
MAYDRGRDVQVAMTAEAVEDGVGWRQRTMTGVDNNCGGKQQRHARSGGGLQQGRDNGGKQRCREQSGNDGCNGGRWRWQTMTAMADDNGGG